MAKRLTSRITYIVTVAAGSVAVIATLVSLFISESPSLFDVIRTLVLFLIAVGVLALIVVLYFTLKPIVYEFWQKKRNLTSLSHAKIPDGVGASIDSLRTMSRATGLVTASMTLISFIAAIVGIFNIYIPESIVISIITLLGLAAVIFSWWFLRRTYIGTIYLKTKKEGGAWGKYLQIYILKTAEIVLIAIIALLVLVSLVILALGMTSILAGWSILLLYVVVVYSVILSTRTSLAQRLDEFYPKLDYLIVDTPKENNQLILPTRCHKGDSLNICLKIKPVEQEEWEAEIQAGGVKVGGDLTQKISMTAPREQLLFFWNCYFENSGSYLVNVLLRRTKHGKNREVLKKSHEIQVITLYRQYATTLITAAVAVLTFLLTLGSSMHII